VKDAMQRHLRYKPWKKPILAPLNTGKSTEWELCLQSGCVAFAIRGLELGQLLHVPCGVEFAGSCDWSWVPSRRGLPDGRGGLKGVMAMMVVCIVSTSFWQPSAPPTLVLRAGPRKRRWAAQKS
jgi:hypothetical protein